MMASIPADVVMEIRVGVPLVAGYGGLPPQSQQQPWTIVPIRVNRHITFADLSAILIAQYGNYFNHPGSRYHYDGSQQGCHTPTLSFFRACDGVQVGQNLSQEIASSNSNFLPESDVLLVRILTPPPTPFWKPTMEAMAPNRFFGFLCGQNSGPQKLPTSPRTNQDLEFDDVTNEDIQEGILRSLETPNSPQKEHLPTFAYGSSSSLSPNSVTNADGIWNASHWPAYGMENDSKPASLPSPQQKECSGKLVAHGSMSQYKLDGGRSACTAICTLAAVRILSAEDEPVFAQMSSPSKLDAWVNEGVTVHRDVAKKLSGSCQQHLSLDEVVECDLLKPFRNRLQKGAPFQGNVGKRQNLIDAFQAAIDFSVGHERLCIILTKSGETVLCVADCAGPEYRWYLFDSHGQSHENQKLAYCKEYPSFHRLLDGFLAKYPFQSFGDDNSIQSSMYNLFEAVPITLFSNLPAPLSSRDSLEATEEKASELPPIASHARASQTSDSSEFKPISIPRGILDRERFLCAISLEVMADPVVASDGHHYDRPQIEMHFEARRAAEVARINSEEARARGDAAEGESANTCCGAALREIELTSPKTGLKIDGTLTPVLLLEEMIVELVQANALEMTNDEIRDWHQRRAEKKSRDTERQARQLEAEAEEEERRRHDAEAEERYGNRSPSLPEELSRQVLVVRDTTDDSEALGENDLGISIALGDKQFRIPPTYAKQDSGNTRCMVACCAVPLPSNTWCARCQRLVCDDCLSFGVSNIQTQMSGDSDGLHRVCFECVTQVVDVMDSQDTLTRQRRAVIMKVSERHLAFLTNRLSVKQGALIRHEMNDEFSQRLEEAQSNVVSLSNRVAQIREQVRREEERAEQAAADDGPDTLEYQNDDLEQISEQLISVERQWEELLQQETPSDEEGMMRYVSRRSTLWEEQQRLSTARLALLMAQPSSESPADDQSRTSLERDMTKLTQLERRLADLQIPVTEEQSLEEQIARATEQIDVASQIEELQLSIAMSQSTSSNGPPPEKPTRTGGKEALIAQLSSFERTRSKRFRIWNKRKLAALSSHIQELQASDSTDMLAILNALEGIDLRFPSTVSEHIATCRREVADASEALTTEASSKREASSIAEAFASPETPPTDAGAEDLLSEFVLLNKMDVSNLSVEDQIHHVERLSLIDASLKKMEEEFFRNELEDVPDVEVAVQARRDIAAIGPQLESWPLPLDLQYPTERMERQLEYLRSTLKLREIESKRTFAVHLNKQYDELVERCDTLEGEMSEASRLLRDAQTTAEEEEERRRLRLERRRQEEEARLAREQALREEERKAREEDEELRRTHQADEDATRAAFENAGGEGGGGAFGMQGDARMCRRCRTGPLYNERCSDLGAHNDSYRDHEGRLRRPNECPNPACRWYNPNWHEWPYYDGIFGPH